MTVPEGSGNAQGNETTDCASKQAEPQARLSLQWEEMLAGAVPGDASGETAELKQALSRVTEPLTLLGTLVTRGAAPGSGPTRTLLLTLCLDSSDLSVALFVSRQLPLIRTVALYQFAAANPHFAPGDLVIGNFRMKFRYENMAHVHPVPRQTPPEGNGEAPVSERCTSCIA